MMLSKSNNRVRRLKLDPSLIIVILLLAIVIVCGFFLNERFGTMRNFMNVLEQSSGLGFASIGQAMVVIVGGIDLSIGAIITASTVFMAAVVDVHPGLMIPMIFGTLLFGVAIGFCNGYLTLKTGVHPLIVTLGTASILNGSVLIYTLQPTGGVPYWFEEFAYGRIWNVPISGAVMIVCFALVWLFLHYYQTGRAFYAVGGSPEAAHLCGIQSNRVILLAYSASGFFAALAGIYFVSRTGVGDPRIGDPITLSSITPVILGGLILGGGKGNIFGVLLGVIFISLLSNLLNYMNISTFIQWVIQGVIIIIAVSVYVLIGKNL